MLNETEEQKEFTKKIYLEKAKNILKIPLIVILLNMLMYMLLILYGTFDFGILFYAVTLIGIIFAFNCINKKIISICKKIIIFSMIPIILLLFCDFAIVILDIETYMWDLIGIDLILVIGTLYAVYTNLCKAEGDKRFEQPTDWFYDKK